MFCFTCTACCVHSQHNLCCLARDHVRSRLLVAPGPLLQLTEVPQQERMCFPAGPTINKSLAPALVLGCSKCRCTVLEGSKVQPQLLILRPLPHSHVPGTSGIQQQLISRQACLHAWRHQHHKTPAAAAPGTHVDTVVGTCQTALADDCEHIQTAAIYKARDLP